MAHTVQSSPYKRPYRDACLDWLQMLSGAALALFFLYHMLMISSILLGEQTMNRLAEAYESASLVQIGGPLLFALFLGHFVLAARKIPFSANGQESIWAHAVALRHKETWLWVVQVTTAMIILVLGSIHMWSALADLPITAEKSALRIAGAGWLWLYIILLLAALLHTFAGAWRIGVKWGFITSENRVKTTRYTALAFAFFVALGLITLTAYLAHAPKTQTAPVLSAAPAQSAASAPGSATLQPAVTAGP